MTQEPSPAPTPATAAGNTLTGKTALITGAARRVGAQIARVLHGAGANVVLHYRSSAEDATRLANELNGTRPNSAAVAECDLLDVSQIKKLPARAQQAFGGLDILVNNAGIVRDAMLVKVKDGQVVGKMTLAQWQAVIDVNLTGVFLCAREAAQRMIKLTAGGVIVNVSSISRAGNPGQTNYSAAKAGVAAMTVVWAKELARYGIRVGAVAPGFVRTPMVAEMKPEALARMTAPVPLGRLGEPDEIAHAVGFIFENEFFTGRCVEVDAGLRM